MRAGRFGGAEISAIPRQADNRTPPAAGAPLAPQWTLPVEGPPGERLVDNHHQFAFRLVARGEIAAFQQRNSHGGKVPWRYQGEVNVGGFALHRRVSLDRQVGPDRKS